MTTSSTGTSDSREPAVLESADFEGYVDKLMREWKVPGLAIAIVNRGKTTVKNYGFANLEEGRLVNDETIFDCASTSKSFTAATVALVLEDEAKSQGVDGKCRDLRTPVIQFLPNDFELEDQYYTNNVTIEDILSHRSGMPRHDDSYLGALARKQDTPCSITRNLRHLPLTRPLRTMYQYCNMMYTVVTHLVSQVSGVPFATFLQKRILDPLGMDNTYLNIPGIEQYDDLKPRVATGYYYSEANHSFNTIPFVDQSEAIGAGSIFSTVSDYARWLHFMIDETSPLSKKSHAELVTPRIIAEPEDLPEHGFSHTLYALGWEVKSYRGHRIIGHDGCVWGFNSSMIFLPDLKWGMVVFCNGNDGSDCIEAIVMTLLDDILDIPADDRANWGEIKKQQFEKRKEESAEEESKEDEGDDEETLSATEPPGRLPLAAYAGTYYHKGYHVIVLRLQGDMLVADCTDRTFQFHLHFQREAGNRFTCMLRDNFDLAQTAIKVRFRLGQNDGVILQLGINFEPTLDDLIWFDRIEEP